MHMRSFLLASTAFLADSLAQPAGAQVALGDTGLSATITGTAASDYLFRGISQTRSRPAYQISTAEVSHTSGFYIGGFLSNVRFLGTDARQELDVFGGYRAAVGGLNFDIGGVWYTYPGYDRAPGQFGLNYAEVQLKASREVGPVNLLAQVNVSPNFFGSSGTGVYVEGGADWKTGVFELTLGGRLGYQWIERNVRFGTPDYAWWSVAVSREFTVPGIGAITASVGYYDTSISRSDCAGGQNICAARALGSLSFKF
jgi:uncharacterized protein (TIGR02001 family)